MSRDLLFGVGPIFSELGRAFTNEGKALLLIHVPVQHVHLVIGQPVQDPLDGIDREVVPALKICVKVYLIN